MKNQVMENKRKSIVLFILCLLITAPLYAQYEYPVPENRLFHIERSKNKNLVCYDAKLEDGALVLKSPLEIYWLDREQNPGQTKGLTAMQKKMAYGYKVVSRGDDTCDITLSAYPGKVLTIKKHEGKYVCITTINGQPAIMEKLYVKANDKNSLTVEYVEVFGVTIDTRTPVSERVENE